MRDLARELPDFPWDSLAPYAARARAHQDGIVDLSVGTPVDPTPEVIRRALADAANAPGYPQTYGTPDLRAAVSDWFARRRGVPGVDPDGVLPTIGSKELVGLLPTLLGLGQGDVVVHPEVAYPTYDVGARLAGAEPVAADGTAQLGPLASRVKLLWVNSPANPTGRVLGVEHLAKVVRWARQHGVIVASDECYAELGWSGERIPSILDPEVAQGSHEGLLAVYSLSKQSNLAGYRAAFVAGDVSLVRRLLEVRKHAGLIVPWPVQRAMVAALGDGEHVAAQRDRYSARRALLRPALEVAGFEVQDSQAGLYLWATRGEDCWASVDWLAERGILVAPGSFYGPKGEGHVRVALTATDERIAAAADRLVALTTTRTMTLTKTVTVFEFAGGEPAFLALAAAHHERCLRDPELNHPFSHPGQNPQHVQRLGAYWAEVMGGPPLYSTSCGDQTGLQEMHSGNGDMSDLGRRFVECFVGAMDDAGLPADPEFRATMRAYMEWAVADVLTYSAEDSRVPAGLGIPLWSWRGLQSRAIRDPLSE